MSEQHVDDLLDEYALGALDSNEVALVETHLKSCALCRDLAVVAQSTASNLLLGAPLVTPPATLRARIAKRAHDLAAERSANKDLSSVDDPPTVPIGSMRRRLREASGSSGEVDASLAGRLLVRLLGLAECAIWELKSQSRDSAAFGRLIGTPHSKESVVVVSGLKPLDGNHVYQIWLSHGSLPTSNATFRVDSSGRGQQIVRTPQGLGYFEHIHITSELIDGSHKYSGSIVLTGKIAS
jgi:anti-sigma factor RsiW